MMKISWARVRTIARREYLTTIRRKAFVFTLIGFPAYFGFVMFLSIRPQMSERVNTFRKFTSLGVVDSSGLLSSASREISSETTPDPVNNPDSTITFKADVRFFPDQASAETALRGGQVSQVIVVPPDYLARGDVRRYAPSSNLFSGGEQTSIGHWITRSLAAGHLDEATLERAVRPTRRMTFYTLNKQGVFELKDDRRELFEFLMPFMFAMMLGMSIVIGGQYLLQGVAEEKESRILESLLSTAGAGDLLAGKLLGLGGAGLTMVAAWMTIGAVVGAPSAMILRFQFPPLLLALAIVYFLLGYLFYGSLMTGIGAMTNNMREAQQFAFMFTFMNFVPMIFLNQIITHPEGPVAMGLSLFPPTAPTSMMLRLAIPSSTVPAWQLAASLALLAGAAWLALTAAARIFRLSLLMYGKTPNLPEIMRWVRQA